MAQYSMKEAVNLLLEQSKWKSRYHKTKLLQDWELIAGKTIAKYTSNLKIENQVLTLKSSVAPLRTEIQYNKKALIEKINNHFGEILITDILVY